jgi:hypothetical protein
MQNGLQSPSILDAVHFASLISRKPPLSCYRWYFLSKPIVAVYANS